MAGENDGRRVAAWAGRCAAFVMVAVVLLAPSVAAAAEDTYNGSELWLHYVPVSDPALLAQYKASVTSIVVDNADQNKVYRHTANLAHGDGVRREAGGDEPAGGEG